MDGGQIAGLVVAMAVGLYVAFIVVRALAALVRTAVSPPPVYVPLPPDEAERRRVGEANERISEYNSVVRGFERLPFNGNDPEFIPEALDLMDRAVHLTPVADQPQMLVGAHRIATILGEELERRDLSRRQREVLQQRLADNETLGRAAAYFTDLM